MTVVCEPYRQVTEDWSKVSVYQNEFKIVSKNGKLQKWWTQKPSKTSCIAYLSFEAAEIWSPWRPIAVEQKLFIPAFKSENNLENWHEDLMDVFTKIKRLARHIWDQRD